MIGTARPKTPPPGDRVLERRELAAIWQAADDDNFGRIVKLLMLLGQRRTEVGGMAGANSTLSTALGRSRRVRKTIAPIHCRCRRSLRRLSQACPHGRPRYLIRRPCRQRPHRLGTPQSRTRCTAGRYSSPWTSHDLRRSARRAWATSDCAARGRTNFKPSEWPRAGVAGIYNRSTTSTKPAWLWGCGTTNPRPDRRRRAQGRFVHERVL